MVKVTPAGEAYIENPFPIQVIRDHTYNPDDAEYMAGGNSAVEAVDKTLYALLKDLLKDMARNENLPPYVIFQDVSLKDMTIQYPVTIEEMTHITGVGVGKAQKYGRPFVDLIKRYVEENDIERPQDIVVKSVVNKSGLKVYIIQSIDRKVSLDDIALAKNLSMDELLSEVERIVESGTRLNIDYYVEDALDADHRDEIYEYFLEADNDSVQQALVETEMERERENNTLATALKAAYDELLAGMEEWTLTYLFVSPAGGILSYNDVWQANQNVTSGDKVFSVVAEQPGNIIGKMKLPAQGSGKVKAGQRVNISLSGLPYLEFGFLSGRVDAVSLLPDEEGLYMVTVSLPQDLRTSYGHRIPFGGEMPGVAEVLTDDRSLTERLVSPLRYVWEKYR